MVSSPSSFVWGTLTLHVDETGLWQKAASEPLISTSARAQWTGSAVARPQLKKT